MSNDINVSKIIPQEIGRYTRKVIDGLYTTDKSITAALNKLGYYEDLEEQGYKFVKNGKEAKPFGNTKTDKKEKKEAVEEVNVVEKKRRRKPKIEEPVKGEETVKEPVEEKKAKMKNPTKEPSEEAKVKKSRTRKTK